MPSTSFLFICLFLFISFAPSYTESTLDSCSHDHNYKPITITVPNDNNSDARLLPPQSYESIRMYFEYSTLSRVTTAFRNYIQNMILPPSKNYFETALKVKRVTGKLKTTETTLCNNVRVPSLYSTAGIGVDADLVIFLTQTTESSTISVTSAKTCALDSVNNRPLFGALNFNLFYMAPSTNEVVIEKDISRVMHEVVHILGFSKSLFASFVNPTTNAVLTGHQTTTVVNTKTIDVLNVEPLTTQLRNHFGCQTLIGAYLENEGGVDDIGSHFERRIFYNELMTASVMLDARISTFTLALLHGSGWYQPDYTMAEPMTYGSGKGCTFLDSRCKTSATTTAFEEFCTPLTKTSCSWTGRGAGSCGISVINAAGSPDPSFNYWGNNTAVSDRYSDNCPNYQVANNMDCENPANQITATLGSREFYGYGAKCFMGTLGATAATYRDSPYGYCFKTKCEMVSGSYVLRLTIGSNTVTCSSEAQITITGSGGRLFCPNPTKYCNQLQTEGFCKRKCFGRGTCNTNKQCVCTDGWTSHDCSKMTYVDDCARCSEGNPFKTSCYGDTCECNPSNLVCMCQLGLTGGSACDGIVDGGKGDLAASEKDDESSTGVIVGVAIGAAITVGLGVFVAIKYGSGLWKSKKVAQVAAEAKIAPQDPNVGVSGDFTERGLVGDQSITAITAADQFGTSRLYQKPTNLRNKTEQKFGGDNSLTLNL